MNPSLALCPTTILFLFSLVLSQSLPTHLLSLSLSQVTKKLSTLAVCTPICISHSMLYTLIGHFFPTSNSTIHKWSFSRSLIIFILPKSMANLLLYLEFSLDVYKVNCSPLLKMF